MVDGASGDVRQGVREGARFGCLDITTGCGSIYQLGSGRYIGWGRVVISSVGQPLYRLVSTRSIGLSMSIYRHCDLLRASSRPPWHCRWTDSSDSVHRLSAPRSTDLGHSVDRLRHFGRPTWPAGSTDFADSVDRLCLPPGELPRGWSFGNHKERRERKDVALRPAKLVVELTRAGEMWYHSLIT